MSETTAQISRGLMDDAEHPYVPGVNCGDCGRFVGRDGAIEIGHFEASEIVAYVEGQCARCGWVEHLLALAREPAPVAPPAGGEDQ